MRWGSERPDFGRTGDLMKLVAALLAVVVGLPSVSSAQRLPDPVVRKLAENAQARFERIRKQYLPERRSGTTTCDAVIGRFCRWNANDTIRPQEARIVIRERRRLLERLATYSRQSPRDEWIIGQRIRYLLDTGADSAALKVASDCIATAWWCDALRGMVLHELGASTSSDSAFARALAAMPEPERCRWTDMRPILDAAQRKRYGKVGCGENEEIGARLWWLADPFLSLPGNDRQAEHYARHTMARILEPTRLTYGVAWAGDLREMIVRYGWARFFTRAPGTSMNPEGGAISGYEPAPNYHFMPVSLTLDSLHEIEFDLHMETSAERYSPVPANRLKEIAPQVARFRRGDSIRVVAAYDVSMRKPFDSALVKSAIVLAADEASALIDSGTSARGVFAVNIDSRPHVLSLEVIGRDHRHAAWMRSGVWLSPRDSAEVEISDILLFTPSQEEVTDLEQVLPVALPGVELSRGKVGMYWEVYGLSRADSALPVTLTLTPVGQSALRRIGQAIRLVKETSPLNIAWRDTPKTGGISTRSVVLDLSLIPRGKYELRVEGRAAGRTPASSVRTILVR